MNHLPVGHSASVAKIDLGKIENNLKTLKRLSGAGQVMAVVKANAYGHGAVEVSRFLESRVSHFAVATVDEGIQLRNAGVEIPVLVFGVPTVRNASAYNDYRLTATVSNLSHFTVLHPGCRFEVNIDTGMKRLGFTVNQVGEVLEAVERHKDLHLDGIYSHYAMADEPGAEFTMNQHELFSSIRDRFPAGVPVHMSNTAAVLHYNVDHFDRIRVGIGLAGYAPGRAQSDDLVPVMDWETTIVQVRPVSRGESVSYGHTWTAPSDGFLATLPVGYADGIPRALGNRLHVNIEGDFFPVVGTITMDLCMVFLGNQRKEPGTIVSLMGSRGWRANRWAMEAGSITHEILCELTPRVRREYLS